MRIVTLALVLLLFLVACSPTNNIPSATTAIPPEAIPTIDPDNEEMANAQFNYNRNCSHCHGIGGEGQFPDTIERTENLGYHLVPPHNASGHTWQHPDQLLFETIKYGVQNPTNFFVMSAFDEQLSDDEIFAIIDYMKLWWTDEQRNWQSGVSEQFTENNPSWTTSRLEDAP